MPPQPPSASAEPSQRHPRPPAVFRASLVGKTGWSAIAGLSATVGSMVSVIVVARLLGVSGSGDVAYGLWLASTVAQIALFSLPQAAMRFLASPEDAPGLSRWIVHRTALLVLPGAGAAMLAGLASGRSVVYGVALAALTAATMLSSTAQACEAGRQTFRRMAILGGMAALVQIIATPVGCLLAGPVGGIVGNLTGQLPWLLVLRERPGQPVPPPPVQRRVLSFAFQSWIAASASLVVWSRLEFAFLQAHGSGAVALYAVALTISQLGIQPAVLVGQALLPHLGELVSGRQEFAAAETYAAATRVLAFLGIPLCLGLAAVAPSLATLIFGAGFRGAATPATIITASASLVVIAAPASALMYAHERTRFNAQVAIASAVLAATSFALVIPNFGPVGAAVVRSLIQGLGVLVGFTYLAIYLHAPAPLRGLARTAAAALGASLAGRFVVTVTEPRWLSLGLAVGTIAVGYALLVTRLLPLEASDVHHLEPVLRSLPGAIRRPMSALLRASARRAGGNGAA